MTHRLAILETHPIQYKIPWFRQLHENPEVDATVFFCMLPDAKQQGTGFGVEFTWDVPLLEGYSYEILTNRARDPGTSRFSGCDTPGVARLVREGGFDAFLVNGWVVKSMAQCAWACRRHGVPCIVRGEANDLRPRAWWKTLVHRQLLRLYSACIAIGTSNRDFYLNRGVAPERIVDGPYCVETTRFARAAATAQSERGALRERWGIPGDAVCFVFSGKLEEKKRPLDLLAALRAAWQEQDAARLHVLIVGDGQLRPECEAYVREHGLPVSFTGFLNQSEIPKAYAAGDCLVLPSDYGETWGLVVNEAFACGLPAIVSDRVGCHPDLVLPDRTGWVVPFDDPPSLAETLARAARNGERLRTMGDAARAHIRSYSIAALVEGTLSALRLVNPSD